jgi:hypothetical protein
MAVTQQSSMAFLPHSLEGLPRVIYGLSFPQRFFRCWPITVRTFRTLVANSEDSLQSPLLQFENIARLKRLMDSKGYSGPISIGGDCTKVRARLTYSNDFGSHVLGSILPLDECEVHETEDIDKVIDHIKRKKATASQTRAIMAKVQMLLFLDEIQC